MVADTERARSHRALSYFRYMIACWVFSLWPAPPALAVAPCPADHVDERTQVVHVHDGDTVRLRDGRRLRLIGIDTPELGRDGMPDQPYAVAARDALRALLAQRPELGLRFDKDRHDVHGRLLAHAYLSDGTSVSAWLLERGYATLLVVPPDEWNAPCYHAAERRARNKRLGIWGLPGYQPIDATRMGRGSRGYHLIKGRISHVGESANSLWLDLEGEVAARVARKDLGYFTGVAFQDLPGKEVVLRGWVYPYKDKLQVRLRYPTDLEIVE